MSRPWFPRLVVMLCAITLLLIATDLVRPQWNLFLSWPIKLFLLAACAATSTFAVSILSRRRHGDR